MADAFSPTHHYRILGNTGIRVSPLGLGTVKFGRNTDVKYPRSFDIPDDGTLENLMSMIRECGINLVDTAPAYGDSETRLGRLLTGSRDQWIISTKVGEYYAHGKSTYDFSEGATVASIEASLRRLKTDYLDIVLVHSHGDEEWIIRDSAVLGTLARLKERGLLRAFGVSSKTVEGGLEALESCDLAMVAYNRQEKRQETILDRALDTRKGILIKKALASGHSSSMREALHFSLSHPAVSAVVVGSIDVAHIRDNVRWVLEALEDP